MWTALFLIAADPTVIERVDKARTEINTVENAANRAVYACTRNDVPKCLLEAKAAANAASRALYAIDQAKKSLVPPEPVPPADGWFLFPLSEPYHGLNKATYARALLSCQPLRSDWGPALVAGKNYVIVGWGKHQLHGEEFDHWTVIPEGAGPATATNQSTAKTECLVGIYKVKPEFAWTAPD